MSILEAIRNDELSETPSTPGITRHMAFKGDGCLVLRAKSEPGTVSGWHRHGSYDVYGYVVSGSACFESNTGEIESLTLGPGDFFHVPAQTVHREINPEPDLSNEIILFLRGEGQLVYNIEDGGHPH